MDSIEICKKILALEFHSLETWNNTDLNRRIGNGIYYGEIAPVLGSNQVMNDMDGIVTAFELTKQTEDDRISIRFMPSDTIFNYNATFLCIPRSAWNKILNSKLRRNHKPNYMGCR